ncbi:cytochrome P450 [Phenylobacterium immobile]|uniref:cytochrome P450 n=1 Tax=Phenylobacterium immobile TaxID=21 RepID=UPI000AA10DAC|nr:cytochrome P450 [Phenylobacterium immobile]
MSETVTPALRPPPGSYGLPFLGKVFGTAEFFLFGWEQYFARRRDIHQSTVFKVNLFQPTIAVLDQQGIAPLFADKTLIQDYGFSWAVPPRPLVGDVTPSIFEHGPAHDDPKAFYLALMAARGPALPGVFDAVADEFFGRWTKLEKFDWQGEIEDMAVSLIFEWLLGARPSTADVRLIYGGIFLHMAAWAERPFPNSNYNRSLKAYGRLVDFIRTSPRYGEVEALARSHGVSAEALPHQLAFLLGMNGFLGTQSMLKSIVGELSRQGGLQDDLQARLVAGDLGAIFTDSLLDGVIREVLRLHPPVFFIFGRATEDRALSTASGDFAIRKGELVMGVIPFALEDPSVYPDPLAFDANRYVEAQAREALIWSRGPHDQAVRPDDKICPGKDPAVLIGKLFCARLATGYRWRLVDPPHWTRKHYGLNVAAPVGALALESFEAIP